MSIIKKNNKPMGGVTQRGANSAKIWKFEEPITCAEIEKYFLKINMIERCYV